MAHSRSTTGSTTSAATAAAQKKPPDLELPVKRMTPKSFFRKEGKRRRKVRAEALFARLSQYVENRTELTYETPFQLLVAVILSANATDVSVNKATPKLFADYPDAKALAAVEPSEIEPYVKSINHYRNKSRAVVETARALVERHNGEVPRQMEEMTTLRGVGRKTANVVLGTAFNINEGIAVDTHANRVSTRLALSVDEDPKQVEAELMELFERQHWTAVSHRLILLGRYICKARKPACRVCPVIAFCPSREMEPEEAEAEPRRIE